MVSFEQDKAEVLEGKRMVDVENSLRMKVSTASGEDTIVSSFGNQDMPLSVAVPQPKKKRNLPGMPGNLLTKTITKNPKFRNLYFCQLIFLINSI
jgi:hypothetical protein